MVMIMNELKLISRFKSIFLFLRISLDNVSNNIRWSVDFRFKKTGLPNGMHGLKDDVILRSSADPSMKIDWSEFSSIERLKLKLDKEGNRVDVSVYAIFGEKKRATNLYIHVYDANVDIRPTCFF